MPIKGLSKTLRIPRAGHVRIGKRRPRKNDKVEWVPPDGDGTAILCDVREKASKKGGTVSIVTPDGVVEIVMEDELKVIGLGGIPEKLDYMRFDPYNKELLPILTELFGERPTSIPVTLALDDEWPWDKVFPQYMMMWRHGQGLVCKGDGEVVHYRVTKQGDKLTVEEGEVCDPETCAYALPDERGFVRCRRVASLQFLIRHPKLKVLAVWQIDTGSIHSIINVNSRLRFFKDLDSFGHSIQGIPLVLTVTPREVHPEGHKRIVYVLDLELDPAADLGGVQLTRDFSEAKALEAPAPLTLPEDCEELRDTKVVEVELPDPVDAADVPGELFPPGAEPTLTLKYEELPEVIREGCEILKWIPGQAIAELQGFCKEDGTLDEDAARKFLAKTVDAELAKEEAGSNEGPDDAGSPEGDVDPLGL